jgi:cytidylate kinase
MKGICAVVMIIGLFAPAAAVSASTLANADGQSYVVEVINAGQMYRATILDGSTAALCTYTCQLILPQTGQSVTAQRDDDVVIDNGVMTVGH